MADLLIKNISKELRNQFKALCSLSDTSMREVIVDFMKEKVESAIGNEKGQGYEG